jgi:hypothetical protein
MGTTQRTKSNGFLALPVAQKSARSTGGGPSGELPGTRREPAPTTHGGYGRNTTGGWLADDPRVVPPRLRACGVGGAGFGVHESGINPTGGAMPSGGRHPSHRARENEV